jgi:hypothetical protein
VKKVKVVVLLLSFIFLSTSFSYPKQDLEKANVFIKGKILRINKGFVFDTNFSGLFAKIANRKVVIQADGYTNMEEKDLKNIFIATYLKDLKNKLKVDITIANLLDDRESKFLSQYKRLGGSVKGDLEFEGVLHMFHTTETEISYPPEENPETFESTRAILSITKLNGKFGTWESKKD